MIRDHIMIQQASRVHRLSAPETLVLATRGYAQLLDVD
jgi:hypothetical protein